MGGFLVALIWPPGGRVAGGDRFAALAMTNRDSTDKQGLVLDKSLKMMYDVLVQAG